MKSSAMGAVLEAPVAAPAAQGSPSPLAAFAGFWTSPQVDDWIARHEARVLFGVARSATFAFVLLAATLWIPGVSDKAGPASAVLLAACLPLVAAVAVAHRGRLQLASRIVVVDMVVGAMASVACFGGLRGPVTYSLPLSIALAGLLRGRRSAAAAAAANVAFVGVEAALEHAGVAPFVAPAIHLPAGALAVAAGIGIAVGLIAVFTRELDSARREALESARRALASEHDLADLVRFAPDGVAVLDADGVIVTANAEMARIAGRSADALIGHGLADLPGMADPCTREAVLEGLARLHERGAALWELALDRGDGSPVPVEVNARIMARGGGRRVLLVVRDRSDRAMADAARSRLEAELREARRMEGLGRLAGGVAHDVRNLLTPILVNAAALGDAVAAEGTAAELVREIDLAAQRANGLTQQLLAFARRQVLEIKAIDLNGVIRELEPILRRLVREDVTLRFDLAADLGPLNGDRSQLEQVLVNLVANARDAMPRGGAIRVETANAAIAGEGADATLAPGRYVALAVADTGEGMSEEVRRQIFEPFFTTKAGADGTGLGLATVHGIVAQLGGRIDVESAVGSGTRFRILLPMSDARAARAEPAEVGAACPLEPRRVLVVDDDDLVRAAVARTLRSVGLDVTEARTGEEALAIAVEANPQFDLVVTDVVMPRLGGRDLAERLRNARPHHRVLFMSGFTEDSTLLEAAGIETAFIPKPFSRDGLLARVTAMLDS